MIFNYKSFKFLDELFESSEGMTMSIIVIEWSYNEVTFLMDLVWYAELCLNVLSRISSSLLLQLHFFPFTIPSLSALRCFLIVFVVLSNVHFFILLGCQLAHVITTLGCSVRSVCMSSFIKRKAFLDHSQCSRGWTLIKLLHLSSLGYPFYIKPSFIIISAPTMLLCWMLLIQAVMDIIANLKQNCFSDGVSFVFVALCVCIRSKAKERRKNCFMIGRGATAQHTHSLRVSSPQSSASFFDIPCYGGSNCAAFTNTSPDVEAPLCNHVVYSNKGYHIEWLVVFSPSAFFQSIRTQQQLRRVNQAHFPRWCALSFRDRQCKRLFYAFHEVFVILKLSSVLVWFILRMAVLFWRRAISRVQRKRKKDITGLIWKKSSGKSCKLKIEV